jgi:crotonobetainyl-CoA:carnitine CoA-transferase CaiB-like acyl-CoA transferase
MGARLGGYASGRNKQTVVLDLKQEADRDQFMRLAEEADAVVKLSAWRP